MDNNENFLIKKEIKNWEKIKRREKVSNNSEEINSVGINSNKYKLKICFITTLIGDENCNLDKVGNLINHKSVPYDFFLFTNIKSLKNDTWQVINIKDEFLNFKCKIDDVSNRKMSIYKSRYIKFMGWEYLKNVMGKEYDVIFYCDAIYSPNLSFDWQEIAKKILNSESGILQKMHPNKHSLSTEIRAIVGARKDTNKNMDEMKKYIKSLEIPADDIKITENTTFGYNPKNNKIINAFTDFWKNYINLKISYRDQPLWASTKYKLNINPIIENNLHKCLDRNSKFLFRYNGVTFSHARKYV